MTLELQPRSSPVANLLEYDLVLDGEPIAESYVDPQDETATFAWAADSTQSIHTLVDLYLRMLRPRGVGETPVKLELLVGDRFVEASLERSLSVDDLLTKLDNIIQAEGESPSLVQLVSERDVLEIACDPTGNPARIAVLSTVTPLLSLIRFLVASHAEAVNLANTLSTPKQRTHTWCFHESTATAAMHFLMT